MKYKFLLFLLVNSQVLLAQKNLTISGYIKDKRSAEALIGAVIAEGSLRRATTTNGYGYYSLTLPKGSHTIKVSYVGYESLSFEINLQDNIYKDINLSSSSLEIEEVTVVADYKRSQLNQNEFNAERMTLKNIRQLPNVFGEVDVIKAVQMQSGVKTIGDGSSAMFVRGGGSDQNLILIDEAPVYNPSHLFGLVSVFNPDALNHLTLYKSNMPAHYGGRVSAVLDCKMKEGNLRNHDFSIGISPFSAIFTANGPIVKEQSSFLVSARKSLVDLVFSPGETMVLVPGFHDLNIKVNSRVGRRNRLFLSVYRGNDRIESAEGFFNNWGNTTATLRWNTNIGAKLFSNISIVSSDYQNYLEFKDEEKNYKWLTGVNDVNLKADLSYFHKPNNVVKFGVSSIFHRFIPGESADTALSLHRMQALEHGAYVSHDIKFNRWLGLNYGIRISVFQNIGKAKWYEYNQDYTPVAERRNAKGVYNTYWAPEPRISINLSVSPHYSLKAAYARNAQYIQVLQNNALSYSSLETWFPANPNMQPIIANTYSLGWFYKLSDSYYFSVESYYKDYQNQIDYVDHAKLTDNPYIEGEIRTGNAFAYGIEMLLKIEKDDFTGNVNYTYSRAMRQIEGINSSAPYSSPFDIPHDFRINGNYKLSPKWSLSAAWVYMSGRPVTLPIGFYFENPREPIPIYSGRNSSRFPDYHRLDLAVNYSSINVKGEPRWNISFGLFNAYARKNPLGYEFTRRIGASEINSSDYVEVYQFSLFSIMPNFSVKYNF
ncbi:MAG: TonB-dependent receptor [Bacteroidales bacterium]